jgi:hypothetical protein
VKIEYGSNRVIWTIERGLLRCMVFEVAGLFKEEAGDTS